jgi:hypothetical protein
MTSAGTRFIPPFASLNRWLDRCECLPDGSLSVLYDDIIEVVSVFLGAVPVDENWYVSEYPAVSKFISRVPDATPSTHFQKHGYFEGRRPFAEGAAGRTALEPFANIRKTLAVQPSRGRLLVTIRRQSLLDLVTTILKAVPVDEDWYRARYPSVLAEVNSGKFHSVSDHFIQYGYRKGYLPFPFGIDSDWYVGRYEHVRRALENGVARDATDHFVRIGYQEGCRPTPP